MRVLRNLVMAALLLFFATFLLVRAKRQQSARTTNLPLYSLPISIPSWGEPPSAKSITMIEGIG